MVNTWYFITLFGEPEIWLMITGIVILFYLLLRGRFSKETRDSVKKGIVIFAVSLWLILGVTFLLKYSIPAERPCIPCEGERTDCNPHCPKDGSFPSGHTAIMFGVSASLVMIFRKKKFLFLFIMAALVGVSRYALGVHYPIDVVAGGILGVVIPVVVSVIYKKFK